MTASPRRPSAPDWVLPVMRLGYATRGVTYGVIGALAVWAAVTGGQAEGAEGALQQVRNAPWGVAALIAVAFGLLAYAVWRLIDAIMDLDAYGTTLKGLVARAALVVTGLLHATLGLSAARIAMGKKSGQDDGTQNLVAQIMEMPNGPLWVILGGIITIGAGGFYVLKALRETYKRRMCATAFTRRLDPALKAGLIAHGVVIALIGAFILYAGMQGNAGEAGGLEKAFATVRSGPFGRSLLFVLAAGTISFGLYCLVQARYRVIPRHAGPDVTTLAGGFDRRLREALS